MNVINKVLVKLHIKKRPPASSAGGKAFLPADIAKLLEENGLDCSSLIYGKKSDMYESGEYADTYIVFDDKGLYTARVTEAVKPKRGSRRLASECKLEQLVSTPITDIDSLKIERYLATGQLLYTKDAEDYPVVSFSLGLLAAFEELTEIFNAFKDGKDYLSRLETHKEEKCAGCGAPVKPGATFCKKCSSKTSTALRLMKFFSPHKGKLIFILATMLFGTAVNLYTPQIGTKTLFNEVLNAGNTSGYETLIAALGSVVLTIVAIKLFGQLFTLIYQYILAGILPWVIYDIKVRVFTAMQKLSVGFFTHKQTGSLMERVTRDSNNIYWFFIDGFPYLIISAVTVIGVLLYMLDTSPRLTLTVLAASLVIGILYPLFSRVFTRLHHRVWVQNAALSSKVSDNINGHRIIKAFSKEDEELKGFGKVSGRLMDAEITYSNAEATVFPLLSMFVYGLAALVLGYGGLLVVRGEMLLGDLLTFVVYMQMLQAPIEFLSWVFNWWTRCADSAHRVFEIIDAKPDVTERENPVVLPEFRGDIHISELKFEYEPARPVIKSLNLDVKAGQMLGIVGKTGAGKSTIANLIARLYDAKDGVIQIDGTDVKDLSLKQLRSSVGIVSQDIFLFLGTIADNIRYARPDATDDEVIAAAKAAAAHDFIMKLPDGYETRVGSGGQDLSGGERQRVSIARTLIQDPKILILDEATAAMDTETERQIQGSLAKLKTGRTTIAIAHRLSTLREADALAVIDDGKVVESGTFRELMEKKGEYYKLYKVQSEALKFIGIGEEDTDEQ